MGVSFNLEHKINACGCQFWDALSCQIAHRCNGTLAEGQKVWLADGSSWPWRDVEPGTQLLGGARASDGRKRRTCGRRRAPGPVRVVVGRGDDGVVLALVAAAAGWWW